MFIFFENHVFSEWWNKCFNALEIKFLLPSNGGQAFRQCFENSFHGSSNFGDSISENFLKRNSKNYLNSFYYHLGEGGGGTQNLW